MNTAGTIVEPRIAKLHVTESEITAYLVDGHTVSVRLLGRGGCPTPRPPSTIIGN